MNLITESQKVNIEKWKPYILESLNAENLGELTKDGDTPLGRMNIMAQIAQNKEMRLVESGNATPSNSVGIGAVEFPGQPGNYDNFYTQKRGSIDMPINILGMSMTVAARTIAFDIVPVLPINTQHVFLTFLDSIYAGGRMDSAAKPMFLKFKCPEYLAETDRKTGDTLVIYGGAADSASAEIKIIQNMRLESGFIIKVLSTGTATAAGKHTKDDSITLDAVKHSAAAYTKNGGAKVDISNDTFSIDYANPNDDHVKAASAYGNEDGKPVSRSVSEKGGHTIIELNTYSKSVTTHTFTIEGRINRQQAAAYMDNGIDGVPIIKRSLQNELTQSINDDILDRMRRLGVTNHANLYAAQGINLNLYVGPVATASKSFTDFKGVPEFIDKRGLNRTAEFGNITNGETHSAAETMHTRQMKIATRIVAAAVVVGHVSRLGAADCAIVNSQILTAVKMTANFAASPIMNTLTQNAANLYYAGTLAGIKIYCNPKLGYNDTTVIVARTNKSESGNDWDNLTNGLVFLPYDLASVIQLMPESTLGSKIVIDSIYAIAETGKHPQAAYMTFAVDTDFDLW